MEGRLPGEEAPALDLTRQTVKDPKVLNSLRILERKEGAL
jgi:hypothetical protein